MIVYLDADYRCYVTQGENRVAVDADYFNGKCPAYIEGYRFVPEGETWVREDGETFRGEMIAPWKPWEELNATQREFERQQLMDANAQNAELLETMAAMVEEVYESDLEVFQWGGDGL